MAKVKITIGQGLANMPFNLRQKMAIASNAGGLTAAVRVKEQTRAVGAVASKELVNSVQTTDHSDRLAFKTKTGYTKKHGYWVEVGRKAGKLPGWQYTKAILKAWAANKGLIIDDAALWFIAKKIRERGFAGRFPVKKAREIVKVEFYRQVRNEIEKLFR